VWLRLQLHGHGLLEGETAAVDPLVWAHGLSIPVRSGVAGVGRGRSGRHTAANRRRRTTSKPPDRIRQSRQFPDL
jgi:hypothetical protein